MCLYNAGNLESGDGAELAKKGVPNAESLKSSDEAEEATTIEKGVPNS